MTDAAMISKAIRTNIDQIVETEDSMDKGRTRYEQDCRRGNFSGTMRNFDRKIAEESIEIIPEMEVMTEAEMGTGLKGGNFPETLVAIEIEVQATIGPGQDQEPV